MLIASWNVNSVRARISNILDYLKASNTDVLMIQEIKTEEKNFPFQDFKNIGYNAYVFGQKSYNGVAFVSKINIDKIDTKFFVDKNKQSRIIVGDIKNISKVIDDVPILSNEIIKLMKDLNEKGKFTLIFLGAENSDEETGLLELTYNWNSEEYTGGRNFGHLAYRVDDIYGICKRLLDGGVAISRPPRDGHMAFIRSPDGISIELLQRGDALPPSEPWASMPNTGEW
mgnify:CR=1 FL=1